MKFLNVLKLLSTQSEHLQWVRCVRINFLCWVSLQLSIRNNTGHWTEHHHHISKGISVYQNSNKKMSAICYLLMFRWQGTCESFEKTTKYSKSWIMGPKHEAPWNPPAQERGSGWIFQTGSNSDDEVHGMAQDSNGNIIVAGETQVERWCFKNFLGKLSEAIPLRYFLFLCVCFFFKISFYVPAL